MRKLAAFALIPLVALLVVAGCNNDEQTAAPAASPSSASLPAGLVVVEAPPAAQDVATVKKSAKHGDAIVVNGWIGGTEDPMAKNRAIMTVADRTLPDCKGSPMETCPTPWDSCCEPIEARTAKTVTVQVVDANGKPLPATLENVAGLKPLSKVTVSGIAKRAAGSDALIVEAKQIHVTP